jgi:hypothetical protein
LKLCEAVGLPPTAFQALCSLKIPASLEDRTARTGAIEEFSRFELFLLNLEEVGKIRFKEHLCLSGGGQIKMDGTAWQ